MLVNIYYSTELTILVYIQIQNLLTSNMFGYMNSKLVITFFSPPTNALIHFEINRILSPQHRTESRMPAASGLAAFAHAHDLL